MKVVVLGGGRSDEHEVSKRSAASVAEGLSKGGHEVVQIELSKDGLWLHDGQELPLLAGRGLLGADVVFPVLHGPFGEDGTVQGLLELLDVPYVGSPVLGSAAGMDKLVFKDLMKAAGIAQVDYEHVYREEWQQNSDQVIKRLSSLGLPVWVKPSRLGSSVGIMPARSADELAPAIEQALQFDGRVIVEASAPGHEIEVAVLGRTHDVQISQPGQIVLTSDDPNAWYDHEAKYVPGGMELKVPAQISETAFATLKTLAEKSFAVCACDGLARADFFVDGETVLLNELNTLPGFTSTSVYGALWNASGLDYVELLDRLLDLALERFKEER